MANRLQYESSPYLRQHAHNPVDWHPWGEEALRKAREEDKPILLSIGYAACHWCHVMERESFENEGIARLMNENFVSIKVDREERPDLDAVYMQAVQAMTGRGGWPMTVFLTPDGKPFYSGTYFPPEDRMGMPGFPRVLEAMAQMYRSKRHEVEHVAEEIRERLQDMAQPRPGDPAGLREQILTDAFHSLQGQFDDRWGGLRGAPKFPQPMTFEFLLRYHHRFGEARALEMVEYTLERMAYGGMYDQVGGGFHRYSTDEEWLVPHFEKMLYDNALLARLYLHAYQVTGRPLFRRIVEETLDYVLREMTSAEGGFYSTQDADSEGKEGVFYVWRPEEVQEALGDQDGHLVCRYYGVTPQGNFEGHSILHVPKKPEVVAKELGLDPTEMERRLTEAKRRLLKVRIHRSAPGLDDKVLASWNGLMLRAVAQAGATLQRDDYLAAAERNASFLLERLRVDGRLYHTYRDGVAKVPGYLDDYAFLADALLTLHEATLDHRWLQEAQSLVEAMIQRFWDEDSGAFFDTGPEHEELLVRPREFLDTATPAGASVAAEVLLRLGTLLARDDYKEKAVRAVNGILPLIGRFASAFGQWLGALDFALSSPREIVILGSGSHPATLALKAEVFRHYLPNKVVTGAAGQSRDGLPMPLLEGKGLVAGRPTAYVCFNFACAAPTTDPQELARQLAG